MGSTKNHLYTQDQIELAKLFKALAHPARIAIVENLLIHDNLNCTDLRFYVQLSQSIISTHLKQLHDVGVLAAKVVKSGTYYKVNIVALEQIAGYLQHVFPQAKKVNRNDLSLYFSPLRYSSPQQYRYRA